MSDFVRDLRQAISATILAKEGVRAAGTGLWAAYVRATMWDNAPSNEDQFDARHTAVLAEMEAIAPLSKEERNSVTSAKSVIKKAVQNGVDVWKRDESGFVIMDEHGKPTPRGKNDLQDAKSDYDRMLAGVDALIKKFGADTREPFSQEQLDTLSLRLLGLAESIRAEAAALAAKGSKEAPF